MRQRANYLEAGLETEAGLEEGMRLLQLRKGQARDPDDRRRMRSQLLDASRVLYSMVADHVSIDQIIDATQKLLDKWSRHRALPLSA